MKDITVYQNLSHIEPMVSPSVIKPLCVPLNIDDSFTAELSSRRAQSVYSLWKRLGLVYLQEDGAAPAPVKSDIIVNNFSSHIIFQLFSQNNTHRLIESNQPGLVLFEKIFSQVSKTEKLTSKKISSQLSKLLADKAVFSHELGGLVSLLMGEHESRSAVSEQALNTALVQVLRRVTEEKQLDERRIAVLECAAKAYERLGGEKNRTSQDISQLLEAGRPSADSRLSEASKTIALRMIQSFSQAGGQSGVSRAAAEKAADIALSRTTAQEAEKAVQEAVVRFYETNGYPDADTVSGSKAAKAESGGALKPSAPVGRVIPAEKAPVFGGAVTAQKSAAEQSAADGVSGKNEAGAGDEIIRADSGTKESSRASALGTTDVIAYDGQRGEAGSDGKSGENARGVILQPTANDPAVFQAAVFLLDQASEERGISADQNRITELFGRLSVSSIRRIISETAQRYTREIFRIASQKTATGSDGAAKVQDTAHTAPETAEQRRQDSAAEAEVVQRVIEQAIQTARLALGGRQDALSFAGEKQRERRSMSAGLSARISAYSVKTDGMSAALGKRVSRYIADKFRYEQRLSSDDAIAANITDYALLAKAGSESAGLGEIAQAISAGNAFSAELRFSERYLLDKSGGVIRAKAVTPPHESSAFPLGETYFTENGTNIENSQSIRNVQNISNITNVTNAAQGVPVGEVKPLSAAERGGETYYTENGANIENSQSIRNAQNVTNVTNAAQGVPVGEIKPLSAAERGGETYYSENGTNIENSQIVRNVQNVTNVTNAAQGVPVGEVKPLSAAERGGETYYTENGANIENSQSIRNAQNVTNVTNAAQNTPVGEIKPLSAAERGGETYFSENGTNIENSQIVRNVQNVTNVTNAAQNTPVGEIKPLSATERGEETYFTENGANIENSQSIRNVQNAANITNVTNAAQGAPVGEIKPLNATERGGETYYTENGTNIENSQIVRNVQNVTNVTNAAQGVPVGEIKPLSAAERGGETYYTENGANIDNSQSTRNVQDIANITNITNAAQGVPVGEIKPLSAAERGGEPYYTENGANIDNSQSIRNAQNIANITNVTNAAQGVPVGEIKPLSAAERGGETYFTENGTNIENSQIVRNVQNVTNVTNAAQGAPVGEVKPLSATERGGETYFTENGANIENPQIVRNVQNIANITNVTNAAQNTPVGEIKPLSATERGGDVYYIENEDTASVIRPQVLPLSGYKMNVAGGVYRAARAETADKHGAFIPDNEGKRGRFIPPEPSAGIDIVNGAYSSAVSSDIPQRDNSGAELSLREYDNSLFPERKTQEREIISSSLRNRLDSSTIAALDRLIKQAHGTKDSVAAENHTAYAVSQAEKPSHISEQLSWQEQNNDVPEGGGTLISSQGIVHRMSSTLMRLIHRHLKAAAMTKTDISVSAASLNSSSHISRFIKSLEQSEQNTAEGIAQKSRISFRTIEDSESMVMLIPPAEMDRYEAESGYVRSLPPIEYKQKAEPEQRESASPKPKTINSTSTEQTVKKAISGGFDSMTREQINRLADKVYAQIEARILRERRRIGR